MPAEKTALYRLFGEADELLYIGISQDPKVRWQQHVDTKPWATQVVMRVIEWFESRSAALIEEIRAIRLEHPRHNIVRYRPHVPPKTRRPASVPAPVPTCAEEVGLLTMADIAVMLGVKVTTVRHHRASSLPGCRYASHPFPEPDGHLSNAPYWDVNRELEIREWAASRPGQGVGGGRRKTTETTPKKASEDAS